MELKDKIREIIITVYNGGNEQIKAIEDIAVDRIMKLIEEDKKETP
ncbi:MAG: hypothetical protein KAX30_04505 [Candidatus Atribacteria bacterium]|nr:hypothetical protein [Candidatus Atribacteria bacterium]